MKKTSVIKYFVIQIVLFGIMSLSLPVQAMAIERMALADAAQYSILSSVLSFYRGAYSESGPEIKIFGVGGGDPAMNGEFVYVSIEYNSEAFVWETGLNVHAIQKISFAPGNIILIDVKEDFMSKESNISSRKQTYQVKFYVDKDVLQKKLTLEKKK